LRRRPTPASTTSPGSASGSPPTCGASVFDHLLTLPPSYFEAGRTGAVISRLTSDTTLIENAVGSSLSIALRNLLILIGGLVMLFTTNLKLTLLVLAGVPLVVAPIVLFGRRVRRFARISQDRVADLGNRIDETIHEIRIVQAYGHESADRREFAGADRARFRHRAGAHPQSRHAGGRGAGAGVRRHLADPLGRRPRRAGGADHARAALGLRLLCGAGWRFGRRPVRILGRPAARRRRHRTPARTARRAARCRRAASADSLPARPRGEIVFEGVGFRYPSRPDTPALEHFSLRVAPGETVALVGPSGAGKTTVFQLLLRFYDPQSGSLLLDGVPLAEADPLAVRRAIALVPQEAVIFATSVLENVRYARPEASAEEVRAACIAALCR
jgi:ATP-binding cassette subfamily B protein